MKIRSSLEVKQKSGEFVGSFSPYGYMKSPENKNHVYKCTLCFCKILMGCHQVHSCFFKRRDQRTVQGLTVKMIVSQPSLAAANAASQPA